MNMFLDERRMQDRPVELRAEAAQVRLARSGESTLRQRLARTLHAWAARLDTPTRAQVGGPFPEDSRYTLPNYH